MSIKLTIIIITLPMQKNAPFVYNSFIDEFQLFKKLILSTAADKDFSAKVSQERPKSKC